MLATDKAWEIFKTADLIYSAEEVSDTMRRMAGEISVQLADKQPLLLSVMTGATVFAGQLLPLLEFPLDFDYVQVSRYGDAIRGGQMVWKVPPPVSVKGQGGAGAG